MEERNLRGVISPSLTFPDCETLPSQESAPSSCTAVAFVGKKLFAEVWQNILKIRTFREIILPIAHLNHCPMRNVDCSFPHALDQCEAIHYGYDESQGQNVDGFIAPLWLSYSVPLLSKCVILQFCGHTAEFHSQIDHSTA